ncbi:glutaredoxin family protein [Patescibacteria group bacterium]|nr:glutaredoxin family protein [Patescibacteria group bacterium]
MPTEEKNVAIYSTPTCHFCQLSKEFFKENGVAYQEYNVAADMEKRNEMMEKSGGLAVPVIVVNDEVIVGFDKEKLTKALGIGA